MAQPTKIVCCNRRIIIGNVRASESIRKPERHQAAIERIVDLPPNGEHLPNARPTSLALHFKGSPRAPDVPGPVTGGSRQRELGHRQFPFLMV